MNITKENIDDLNAILRVTVSKEDYEQKVNEVLRDYKKKTKMKGFRPGKVPFSMVKKMYGKQVLVEQVNQIVSESISNYLEQEDLDIMGEPLIREQDQQYIDWDNQEEFEFVFDIGLTPEVNLSIDENLQVPYYKIKIDDQLIDEYIKEYAKRYGQFNNVEQVENEEMLKGELKELDENGDIKRGGVYVEEGSLSINMIQDDAIKKQFEGAQINDTITFDIKQAYPNETDLASLLNINKEDLPDMNAEFQFTIKEILQFQEAEVNQQLFDNIYGEGEINSEEEFRERISQELEQQLAKQSEQKLTADIRQKLIEEANIDLPKEFLKRWILTNNKDNNEITEEKLEQDFPQYEEDLKWQVIKNKIAREHNLQVTEEEINEHAKQYALMQLQQYGIPSLPDEQLQNFADEMLNKDEERRKITNSKLDEKIMDFVKEHITTEEQEVSRDEFNKLIEQK